MTDTSPLPEMVSVSLASLISVGIEHWRLVKGVSTSATPSVHHALRKIEDFLRSNGIEIQTLDGRPFDPGLAVRVVDTVEDETFPTGKIIIDETLSPMVLHHGRVVKPADIVTRAGRP